jgi:GntR family transcriptional regulator
MAAPLYRLIADDLREQIESGRLQPGQMLQTELELRETYSASRNTIRDAIRWLTTRGLVESRAGQGTFVITRIDPLITALSPGQEAMDADERLRMASVSEPKVEIQGAPLNLARMLHLPPEDAEVVSRQQLRFIDGTPWSLQTSFYPMELVTRGARLLLGSRDIRQGALAYLKETLGLDQVGYQDMIQVRPPDMTEAGLFRLPDDGRIPAITVERTDYTAGPVPFRVTITVFPADRNRLLVSFGDVLTPGSHRDDI